MTIVTSVKRKGEQEAKQLFSWEITAEQVSGPKRVTTPLKHKPNLCKKDDSFTAEVPDLQRMSDGCFLIPCSISLRPDISKDDGAELIIEVTQDSEETQSKSTVLEITAVPPSISDIKKPEEIRHSEPANLSWDVTAFSSEVVSIVTSVKRKGEQEAKQLFHWEIPAEQVSGPKRVCIPMKNVPDLCMKDDSFTAEVPDLQRTSDGCFLIPCSISLRPDISKDDGAELIIEVKQDSEETQSKSTVLHVTAVQFANHTSFTIVEPQCNNLVGDSRKTHLSDQNSDKNPWENSSDEQTDKGKPGTEESQKTPSNNQNNADNQGNQGESSLHKTGTEDSEQTPSSYQNRDYNSGENSSDEKKDKSKPGTEESQKTPSNNQNNADNQGESSLHKTGTEDSEQTPSSYQNRDYNSGENSSDEKKDKSKPGTEESQKTPSNNQNNADNQGNQGESSLHKTGTEESQKTPSSNQNNADNQGESSVDRPGTEDNDPSHHKPTPEASHPSTSKCGGPHL
ncbi:uncharacterized protein DDB_G0287625-like [Scyliorhinus canicula]|uniref:uncharacterized protein DDB_G0287625-like n=1 Tax=Scyliorhinus canicula TaxID=7830 RepID=UPI0018F77269|nr:uncharacterized protein DDB_G0287625-like [Scyliorhinus canicula]